MHVVISSTHVHATLKLSKPKHFATSYLLFSLLTTSPLMKNIFYKYMERLWELKWPLQTQAIFEANASTHDPHKRQKRWCYVDDIFMIWRHSLEYLDAFTTSLNGIHPTIKVTCNRSFTWISQNMAFYFNFILSRADRN